MKSFKNFLTERISNVSYQYFMTIFGSRIIMSNALSERLNTKLTDIDAWHITDIYHFNNLKKIQGKQRHISASLFTKASYVESGIATDGGLLVHLEGDLLHYQDHDVFTNNLPGGRRVLDIRELSKKSNDIDKNQINKDIANISFNLFFRNLRQEHHRYLLEAVNNAPEFLNKWEIESFKSVDELLDFIRNIFSIEVIQDMVSNGHGVHDLINDIEEKTNKPRNVKKYKQIVIQKYIERCEDYIVRRPQVMDLLIPGPATKKNEDYDELILTNFYIKDVYVLENSENQPPLDFLRNNNVKNIDGLTIQIMSKDNMDLYEKKREQLMNRIQKSVG